VARLIGWIFVAVVGYHVILAAGDAWMAARDHRWGPCSGYAALALVGAALVVGALAHARPARRRSSR
jgi:hypothetical protein